MSPRHRPPRWIHTGLGYALGFVVMPVVGSLLTRGVGAYYGHPDRDVKQVTAIAIVRQLADALDRFREQHQRMPTASTGLAALVPEYLDQVPVDPWGNAFVYDPGADGLWADVRSYGSDGQSAGAGTASDISGRFGLLGPRPPLYLSWFGEAVVLLIPFAALLRVTRSEWAAGALAGIGSLCAVLLLALVDGLFKLSLLFPLVVGLTCLTGSVAILRQVPGAPLVTFVAVIVAYVLLGELISV